MAKMDERLEKMVERYREINDLMMQSDVVSDRKTMAKLGREQNELTPIVETYEEYKKAVEELEEAKVLSKEEDKEIREMAQMEVEELEPKIQEYLDRLELLIGIGFGPIFPSTLHAIPDRFGYEHSADITGFHMGGAYAIGFAVQLAFGFTASATTFKITPFVMIALCALLCLFAEFTVKKTAKKDFAPASTETSVTSEKIDGDNAEN